MNKSIGAGCNSRTRLLKRTQDVGAYPYKIPRQSTVMASRRGATTKRLSFPQKQSTVELSKQQLNVAIDGKLYESAKSRRIRQRDALAQSGNQEEAIPLGQRKPKTISKKTQQSKSMEVQDLQKQFEQKSHVRRASITHGLRKKLQKPSNKKRKRPEQNPDTASTWNEFLQESKSYHALANPIQSAKTSKAKSTHLQRESISKSLPASKLKSAAKTKSVFKTKTKTNSLLCKPKTNKNAKSQLQIAQTSKKQPKQSIVPDVATSCLLKKPRRKDPIKEEEPCHPEVIDLLSDSESDNDEDNENEAIRALTNLLQNEAIGRGASPKEMKEYAQCLLRLGLHSREMILDALDFSKELARSSAHCVSFTNTVMANQVVNGWEWMKPFHRMVFGRWVLSQQQRFSS